MTLVREPDAGNPPVRFDEREVETEHGMRLLRHRRGNPDPDYVETYPTAPPLDSTLFCSSLLEGIDNNIKVIKRMAYGFRDDEYFFLKIRNAFPRNAG
jgi:hypothetical protein